MKWFKKMKTNRKHVYWHAMRTQYGDKSGDRVVSFCGVGGPIENMAVADTVDKSWDICLQCMSHRTVRNALAEQQHAPDTQARSEETPE